MKATDMATQDESRAKWADTRNERRRTRYRADPEYRAERLKKSRDDYRAEHGVELETCLNRLDDLGNFGTMRTYRVGDRTVTGLTFTVRELADIIGPYQVQVIYRWKAKGLIPDPIHKADVILETSGKAGTYTAEQDVYTEAEVRAMMQVIGTHQLEVRYYRVTDTKTIKAVFKAVEEAR